MPITGQLRWLLVAGETTAEARQILQEHGIGLVDGLGNAHIELPGLLVHLAGRRRPKTTPGRTPRAAEQAPLHVVTLTRAVLDNPVAMQRAFGAPNDVEDSLAEFGQLFTPPYATGGS
jgi:hypothetical protein